MINKIIGQLTRSRVAKIATAVAILGGGLYLSYIEFMDKEWTTRAGCLIAMLGIWSGLGGIIQEQVLVTRIRRKQRNALTAAQAKLAEHDATADTIDSELAKIQESYDAQIAHAADQLRMSVGFEEVSLVLIGTFIWGFGDLFWI